VPEYGWQLVSACVGLVSLASGFLAGWKGSAIRDAVFRSKVEGHMAEAEALFPVLHDVELLTTENHGAITQLREQVDRLVGSQERLTRKLDRMIEMLLGRRV
jgi:hypothetical protein